MCLSLAWVGDCAGLSDLGRPQPEWPRPNGRPANRGAGETRLALASPLCRRDGACEYVAWPQRRPTEYLSGLHPRWVVGRLARGVLFPPALVCGHVDSHPPLYPLWRVAGPARRVPGAESGGGRHLRRGRLSAQPGGHYRCPPSGAGAGGCPGLGGDAGGYRPALAAGGCPWRRPVWVTDVGVGRGDGGRGTPGRLPLASCVVTPPGTPGLGFERGRASPPAERRTDRAVLREGGPLYVWGRPGAAGLPPRPSRPAVAVVEPAGIPRRSGPRAPDTRTDSHARGFHRLSRRRPWGRHRGGGGDLCPVVRADAQPPAHAGAPRTRGLAHGGSPGHQPRYHRHDYRRLAEGAAHRGRWARPRGAGAGDRGRHGAMARGSRPADGGGRDRGGSWHARGGWVNRNAVRVMG